MKDKEVTFNFPVDTGRMIRAMETDDDVGAIVRLHFEVDRALAHVISAMIPNAEHLNHNYMEQRIRFLSALGLPETRIHPARILNEIRNRFAHKEKEIFVPQDISRLRDAVETLYQRKIPDHFVLAMNRKDLHQEWKFGDMDLR